MKNKKIIGIIISVIAAVSVIGVGIKLSHSTVLREDTTTQASSEVLLFETFDENGGAVSSGDKNNGNAFPNSSQLENVINGITDSENKNFGDRGDSADVISNSSRKNYRANPDNIPAFSGKAYYVINGNIPGLTAENQDKKYFEDYSALDNLGRCGVAYACLGKETMPTEDRGEIGQVKPSGWKTAKYDCVDGKYLYNRCHLIGFQLSGENANNRNLITGTRYMNVDGMLPFENMVADYIKETGNHVLYRVTPIFKGNELVARGVQMEAYSVEDNGDGICFNVYCYNNQPGVSIDYATGNSELSDDGIKESVGKYTTEKSDEPNISGGGSSHSADTKYVINTSSKKIHLPNCSSVKNMNDNNKKEYTGSKSDLINRGYSECSKCKP